MASPTRDTSRYPDNEVAWGRIGTWQIGGALEYFIISFFKVALDYTYVDGAYDVFYLDWGDDLTYDVIPPSSTVFHQVQVMAIFQFGPAQEAVRYEPARAAQQAPPMRDSAPGAPTPSEPAPSVPRKDGGEDGWI